MTAPSSIGGLTARMRLGSELILALSVICIVAMMVLPLPTWALDVLLAGNIALGVLVLLVALAVPDAVSFAAFPTVLLVTTLYRLALNVSSTRLILLQADAGHVIRSFGEFVVRGNYVVGAVVFAILTLVQFLVIAKGSERVAEVGARFALDALPGKQMAIDADLRSGALSQDEARRRRLGLQRESQFFGAMDGAMKFVKGDAIAAIVIVLVNLVGGLAIGVLQRDLDVAASLRLYGLLTIGDGLVSQIPALLITTAAGLVVTRVGGSDANASLGGDLAAQLFGRPSTLFSAAAFLGALALVPGLPAAPFLVLAALFGAVGHSVRRRAPPTPTPDGPRADTPDRASVDRPHATSSSILSIRLGASLYEAWVAKPPSTLTTDALPALRERFGQRLGLVLPAVRIEAASALADDAFAICVHEVPEYRGTLPTSGLVALGTRQSLEALGGRPLDTSNENAAAHAIDDATAPAAEERGLEVRAPIDALVDALDSVASRRAADLLGLDDAQALLNELERAAPQLVRHAVPKPIALPLFTDVLRRLVDEGVSIRPLREIVEALAAHGATERDPVVLTELARAALKRHLAHRHAPTGVLEAHLVDPTIEDAIRGATQRTAQGTYLALAPSLARDVITATLRARATMPAGVAFIVLTSADLRRLFRRLIEADVPDAIVLSHAELPTSLRVEPVGRIAP